MYDRAKLEQLKQEMEKWKPENIKGRLAEVSVIKDRLADTRAQRNLFMISFFVQHPFFE